MVLVVDRFQPYHHAPVARATWGLNVQGSIDSTSLTSAAALGAKIFRWQPGWNNCEDYTTGVQTLPTADATALATCATLGVAPILVAGYGPPHVLAMTVTLAADVASGSTALPVIENVAALIPRNAWIRISNGHLISAKTTTYGVIVDTINTGTRTLNIGAATNVALHAGDVLQVNQLKYPPIATLSPTDPSITPFRAHVLFLAQQIRAAGCPVGYVALWNEPRWPDDQWDNLGGCFSNSLRPATGLPDDSMLTAIVGSVLAGITLPSGISIINDGPDKSGNSGIVVQGLVTGPSTVSAESIHPYGVNPEAQAWDNRDPTFTTYDRLDPAVPGSNFQKLARLNGANGFTPSVIATECGLSTSNDERHATYALRRVLSLWGMQVTPVLYAYNPGSNYGVAGRQAATVLARLSSAVNIVRSGGTGCASPAIVGAADTTWPLMSVLVSGPAGNLLFVWQRTFVSTGSWANTITPPATINAQLVVPGTIHEVTNMVTGATVTTTTHSDVVSLPVSDQPVMIRTSA